MRIDSSVRRIHHFEEGIKTPFSVRDGQFIAKHHVRDARRAAILKLRTVISRDLNPVVGTEHGITFELRGRFRLDVALVPTNYLGPISCFAYHPVLSSYDNGFRFEGQIRRKLELLRNDVGQLLTD